MCVTKNTLENKIYYVYVGEFYINKSDLLFHVVKHEIMEKLINKCVCFYENFHNHHILDELV